ncbi:MAG: hypothetical protein KBC62_01225 [Candidatus Pacebacteria bacterium]|nr:hypothetical protein [Candidatus Paceibacterota bacterium]MBP9842605.1 hypothetical protein [Candidatus Paceibacterota bacterium]
MVFILLCNEDKKTDVLNSMSISKTKFVITFLVCGFSFLFVTTTLLGTTGPRGFPQYPDSVLETGADSPIVWKRTVATAILPIKIVLIGPLMPYINFLKQEPDTPPPFFGIGFLFYWTLLALTIRYFFKKVKRYKK